jgi:hypothetical protein
VESSVFCFSLVDKLSTIFRIILLTFLFSSMGQQTFSGKDEGIDRRKQIENYWKASKKGRSLRESQGTSFFRLRRCPSS